MNKPAIQSFNLIKTVCALGIIVYHFSCHLTFRTFLPLYQYANGEWGDLLVTIFFIVSGASLYYRYADDWKSGTLSNYFYKRWKSIFPMYYLIYLFFEIQNIINYKSLFFRGNPLRYIFTLLGMDGYLCQNTLTYYIMGEWFTGAIIMLYLLFPVLLFLFSKSDKITFLIIVITYLLFLETPIINPVSYWSITSCLVSFSSGMILMKYHKILSQKIFAIICAISFIILCFFKIPISSNICSHLIGLFLFGILVFIGEVCMKNTCINKIFTEISKISYAIFLLQHVTIYDILGAWNPAEPLKISILLVITIILILCQAKALTLVSNAVVKWIDKRASKYFN